MTESQVVSPAGFWARLAALFIDAIIIGVPGYLLGIAFSENMGEFSIINFLISTISLLYYLVLPVMWDGQTIGKKALGIRIKKLNGAKVGFGTMFMRYVIGYMVYGITIGIAFIVSILMVAFGRQKRSVHDFIAGTYVGYQ